MRPSRLGELGEIKAIDDAADSTVDQLKNDKSGLNTAIKTYDLLTSVVLAGNRLLKKNEQLEKLSTFLSDRLNTHIDIVARNVKPFVRNGRIEIVITDFANSLRDYYEKSPKFRKEQ